MNDKIFSISVSTNTLVESVTSTSKTTTISTINNSGNISSDNETPGTSSSCYSTCGSASSSAENISTVENGELSVFTFMMPSSTSRSTILNMDGSHGSYNGGAAGGRGGTDHGDCHCCNNYNGSGNSNNTNGSGLNGSNNCSSHSKPNHRHRSNNQQFQSPYGNFSIDPFCLDGSHMYSYKGVHGTNNHILSDNFVRLLPRVSNGILLRSLEKGVLFPVVHWAKNEEHISQKTSHDQNVIFNQGVYKELKRVIPPDVWLQREMSSKRRSTWLIIGYKSLEKTLDSSLEQTWKEWTGVRHIYLNLRHDFEIKKISFLHRVHPQDNLELFMYLVLMEIGNVDDGNLIWLLDFVQRTRVERMKGFISAYSQVEQEVPSIDEYLRYFSSPNGTTIKPNHQYKQGKQQSPSNNKTSHVPSTSASSCSTSSSPYTPSASSTSSAVSNDANVLPLPIVDATLELNGNLKFIEKLLEELHQPPLTDYF